AGRVLAFGAAAALPGPTREPLLADRPRTRPNAAPTAQPLGLAHDPGPGRARRGPPDRRRGCPPLRYPRPVPAESRSLLRPRGVRGAGRRGPAPRGAGLAMVGASTLPADVGPAALMRNLGGRGLRPPRRLTAAARRRCCVR